MYQVRIHGRGGQGVVTAAEMLSVAGFLEGKRPLKRWRSTMGSLADVEIDDGVVAVDSQMMTGHTGLFAGGDMIPSDRTVTIAMGHAKAAARHIDAWLRHVRRGMPLRRDCHGAGVNLTGSH